MVKLGGRHSPSEVQPGAAPGGRGRSGAGRTAKSVVIGAHQISTAGCVHQQGLGGELSCRVVRGGTLLFAWSPAPAGRDEGVGSLGIET